MFTMKRLFVLAAAQGWSVAWGRGFHASEAASLASDVLEIDRVENSISGDDLLNLYVLADKPVVIENAVSGSTLDRIRAEGYWLPGKMPSWFRDEVLSSLVGSEVVSYSNESTREFTNLAWGCRRTAKQCSVAWWYSGRSPPSYGARGAPSQSGNGACIHTDALCAPSWSLQVEGSKDWTFAARTPGEYAVPLGDEFFADRVYKTTLDPGDLLVFFNGWHPHSTNPTELSPFTASVHGVVAFEDMRRRLWDRQGVVVKGARYATPSPRLMCFDDVKDLGGFEQSPQEEEECALPSRKDMLPLLREEETPFDSVARSLGYVSAPAAGDFDGDGLVDLVVGQARGVLVHHRNVGDAKNPAFSLLSTIETPVNAQHAAPTAADLDGDGAFELAVGFYDGLVLLKRFTEDGEWVTMERIESGQIRAAPVFVDADSDGDFDLLVGSENGTFVIYENVGNATFYEAKKVEGRLGRVHRLSANRDNVVVVADGFVPILRFAQFQGINRLVESTTNLFDLSLDDLNDDYPLDVATYPSPTIADFDGDGAEDLVLGGLYGTLLYFNHLASLN